MNQSMYLIVFVFNGEITRLNTGEGIFFFFLNNVSVSLYGTSCGSTMITTSHEVYF